MFTALKVCLGQVSTPREIIARLTEFGYTRVDGVLEAGDVSQRGGIVDVFPANFDSPVRIEIDDNSIRSIASFNPATGKPLWRHTIVIILPKKTTQQTVFSSDTPLNSFVDIAEGDYVVHTQHGIGKFLGITRFDTPGVSGEHVIIEYRDGDKLFVPRHDIHLIQKYVSFTKRPPRMYKLGSGEWQRVKRAIQRNIQRFAAELLHVQALRTSLRGYRFSPDVDWQAHFEGTFPFPETPDQKTAIAQVKESMESDYPMDRLVCGDVGYGKTEVALRAAFKAVMDNKQVAILVPTTILAEQHYYNFVRRLGEFPVRVEMLSRFRTKAEQAQIIADLSRGAVDVIIGTHRLLSRDIRFSDLGLLVIDEEQRFGVRAKEKLKHLRLLVDILTMTATPIPRTLYMALAGAKDMSVINTPPQDRIPVSTHIVEFDEDLIADAIEREVRRKGQVFFLHNSVHDIDAVARIVSRLVPRGRIAVAHGQMPARTLEKIMLQFLSADIDVLVCTTIIESGIDIPNANTLIVNKADQFGLADLHQLRGRVGRFVKKAYAYFIVPPKERLSTQARNRLTALERFSNLGAGFHIAFEDLQIRGAGNLLGPQQHGYVTAVGFDLYCRLLKESIDCLRTESEKRK